MPLSLLLLPHTPYSRRYITHTAPLPSSMFITVYLPLLMLLAVLILRHCHELLRILRHTTLPRRTLIVSRQLKATPLLLIAIDIGAGYAATPVLPAIVMTHIFIATLSLPSLLTLLPRLLVTPLRWLDAIDLPRYWAAYGFAYTGCLPYWLPYEYHVIGVGGIPSVVLHTYAIPPRLSHTPIDEYDLRNVAGVIVIRYAIT